MRGQDQEQIDTPSTMAAATAPAFPAGHVPGMDPHLGSSVFGDPSFFDASSHDQVLLEHQNAQAILEASDVDFMNNFFSDPDSMNLIQMSAYDFPSDDKTALFAAATFDPTGGANGTINPSTLAPSQASLHKSTSHMNSHMQFAAPPNTMPNPSQQQTQAPNMSAADYTAANTIHNFKATPGQPFPPVNPAGTYASSWGNFMMPNPPPPNMGLDMSFQHQNGQPAMASGMRHTSFTPNRNVMYFQGIPQQLPSPQLQRHYSADATTQLPSNQQQQDWQAQPKSAHPGLSSVSFGNDPLFQGTHFRNPTPNQLDKSANLVNAPYAHSARLSMSTQAQHHGGRGEGEPARKRRKSQADREDEADWAPSAGGPRGNADEEAADEEGGGEGQALKRRRSSISRQVPPSASPRGGEDDVARRGLKKPRETLTEQQKRQHHIQSEKKRREIINQGYSDLNILVPCLNGGKSGLSRSECLQETASYIEALISGSDHIMKQLGITDADLGTAPPTALKAEGSGLGT